MSWDNISSGASAGSALFGMLSANTNQKRQYGQSKRLMALQNKYQKGLNQQGHDLQMDMWNKTNYKAQLEHMKGAGLNPALMYGMGGGGGTTTGSQSGGSQSMGNVQQQENMGLQGAMAIEQMKLVKAQRENVDADTQNKKDENPNIDKQGDWLDAQTKEKLQNVKVKLQEVINMKTDNKLKQEEINKVKQEVKTLASTTLLNNAKVKLTESQRYEISEMVEVAWANSGIMQENADANMSNAEQNIEANRLREMELELRRELTTMNIDNDQQLAILASITAIFTTLLSGLSRGIPTSSNNTTRIVR